MMLRAAAGRRSGCRREGASVPYVTLLETSANQAYIFASNRQREQVGASELLFRSTTRWLGQGLPTEVQRRLRIDDEQWPWWQRLDDAERNVPLTAGGELEVVVAVSGKALLLSRDRDVAVAVVGAVTQRVLEEAPGLTLLGVTVGYGEDAGNEVRRLAEAVAAAHRQIDEVRAATPPALMRALHDPLTAVCRTSGAPAGVLQRLPDGDDAEPRGRQAAATQRAGAKGLARLDALLAGPVSEGRVLRPEPAKVSDVVRRNAVVHADGNGFGQLFLSLGAVIGAEVSDADRRFIDLYRGLSVGLDEVAVQALLAALAELPDEAQRREMRPDGDNVPDPPAVLPLVLGGDDLTALIDAEIAWEVVTAFLRHFERQANTHPGVVPVLDALQAAGRGRPWLSAAAGIAVVPRAYPFHAAYKLAEQAAASAKRAKLVAAWPEGGCPSSLDVHVHHDATGSDLDLIRARRVGGTGADTLHLVGGPYLLLDRDGLERLAPEAGTDGRWPLAALEARTVARMEQWLTWVRRCMQGPPEEVGDDAEQSEAPTPVSDVDVPVRGISRSALARLREGLGGGLRSLAAARILLRPEHAQRVAAMEQRAGPLVTSVADAQTAGAPVASSLLLDALDLVAVAQVAAEREAD